ncbi:MAG: hypothetical protein A3H01_01620 [Candidatus Wildermuthbacteria bacterium RIFCSPLOWO2_12_FULL_40_9]|uniref:Uncharacterized protein n=2 Tax=Candidatus Wildermuthiibacteriota TaxID=1817923 RepID=A0A1G2REP9_9BACT|nr:MAG: hypothetical protein A3F15_01660 [Candidatus Wildermuthbacteria bacterium RIFCSPHIGHO2_12_FULL_40_12]OHA76416.1 MAG: hypothetical protein A3H01_01620 [Candidatus Wildermuthbacteria bacterium RIFCSPLOWO2_12_FULL_40_9]
MNKKALIVIVALLIIAAIFSYFFYWSFKTKKDDYGCLVNQGYSWCDFKQECVKSDKDSCVLTNDWILKEAKKIIGMDLNVIPNQAVEFNTKEGKTTFSSKGIYYSDLLKSAKIMEGFNAWEGFLKDLGFYNDFYNSPIRSDEKDDIRYNRDNIVCALSRTDNPNNTSSLSLFCGDISETLCNFNASCGRSCQTDSDCNLIVDGCAKKQVCRAKEVKFYNDCPNPSSLVSELDTSISECSCLESQCVPKDEKLRDKN